jgi:hypothetical protein
MADSSGKVRAVMRDVARRNEVRLTLPVVGEVRLPAKEELAYLAGVGLLAALEVVEWPVALVLVAGHALAKRQHDKVLKGLGEALERA